MGSAFSHKKALSQGGIAIIHTDKTSYLPGDQISGRIYLYIFSPHPPSQLILRLEAVEGVHRLIRTNKGQHMDENYRKFIEFSGCLHQWDSGLSDGQIEVPFSFTLPSELPSSFHQEGITFLAYVVYILEVWVKPIEKKEVKFSPIYQYQKLVIRNPVNRVAKSYTEDVRMPLSTCCCIPRGFLSLRVHCEKDLYSPGDVVRVTLEIDNSHGNLDNLGAQVQLMQRLRLKGANTINYDIIIATIAIPGIKAKNKSQPQFGMFDVPQFRGDEHNLETRTSRWPQGRCDGSLGKLGLSTTSKFISSEFYLQTVCKMDGTISTTPKIICPVDICYPDPSPKPVSLPADWTPQIYEKVDLGHVLCCKTKKKKTRNELNTEKMIETEMVKTNLPNTQL